MEGNSPNRSAPESAEKLRLAVEKLEQEVFKPLPPPQRTLPWFIDIFLYPLSISGIIHLAIFIIGPLLIKFSVLEHFDFFQGFMTLIFYLLFVGYFFYYIGFCVLDSARYGLRAPDITVDNPLDKNDCVSQVFLVIGAVAVCFLPAVIYYIITERPDWLFWLLSAVGIFFLPIALLRAVLFDSVESLNPVTIILSICRTFIPYSGLVLIFCMVGAVIIPIILNSPRPGDLMAGLSYVSDLMYYLLGTAFSFHKIAFVYLSMVAAHLLGRFFLKYKTKLDWGF
jgi:hypothetical protein